MLGGRRESAALTAAAALCVAVAFVSAQAPQRPVFRAGVGMVPVYVTVADGLGGFITDLKPSDFELRDNGTIQEIAYFTTAPQPLSVLILIDGSTSVTPIYDTVMEAASAFIVRMLPEDRAAVASFADVFQLRQTFTSDRDALLKHLLDPFSIRMGLETRLYDALTESMRSFGKEEGRRVVLALTDGVNWTAPQSITGGGAQGFDSRSIGSRAIGSDTMIYAVGLWTIYENKMLPPDRVLQRLADLTGGGYVELRPADDMNATFTRIMEELHQQYVLGFMPRQLDGKEHRLQVRVTRPGARVRARQSYLATRQ
jgi:VWFA-related protein